LREKRNDFAPFIKLVPTALTPEQSDNPAVVLLQENTNLFHGGQIAENSGTMCAQRSRDLGWPHPLRVATQKPLDLPQSSLSLCTHFLPSQQSLHL